MMAMTTNSSTNVNPDLLRLLIIILKKGTSHKGTSHKDTFILCDYALFVPLRLILIMHEAGQKKNAIFCLTSTIFGI
jgi:hypothetical protein